MRRWPVAGLAVLVLLGGSYLALWLWAERALERGFAKWQAASRLQGWTVGSAAPELGSWPLVATLTVPDFSVSGGDADIPGGLAWHAERLVLALSLRHPRELAIEAWGAQRLRLSVLPDIPFTSKQFRGVLPLPAGGRAQDLVLRASDLVAGRAAGAERGLTVAALYVHMQWASRAEPQQPVLTVGMRAADVVLPAEVSWPLGARLASVSGDAALNGPLPPVAGLAERAAAWRDGGGVLHASHVTLTWGALNLSGDGTIGLDHDLQPTGAGTARVMDPSATLKALAAHGAITRRAAFAANAVLLLMERVPEGGGSPVVELPLNLRERTLSAGNIPLAKLPTLVWPSEP